MKIHTNTKITVSLTFTDEEGDENTETTINFLPYQMYEADVLRSFEPSNLDAFLKTAVIDNLCAIMKKAKMPKDVRKEMLKEDMS